MNYGLELQGFFLIVSFMAFAWGIRRLKMWRNIDNRTRILSIVMVFLAVISLIMASSQLLKVKSHKPTGKKIVIETKNKPLIGNGGSYGYTVSHDTSLAYPNQ